MKEVYFKKVGRKYIPVREYDSTFCDAFGYGDHLVSVYPGGSSRRKITPAFAPVIAATRYSRDVISKAIMDAASLRPKNVPITPGQKTAWKKLEKEFGDEVHMLIWPSAIDVAEAAGDAMQIEADKMLQLPAVKLAYEHFMLVYQLTKREENESV